MQNPFLYFNSSPEVIRLTVMMYIRYPLSLRQDEDLLFERGIDICHETVRFWWNRFINRCRRLSKDFENLNRTALAFIRLASIRLMLRRLARYCVAS